MTALFNLSMSTGEDKKAALPQAVRVPRQDTGALSLHCGDFLTGPSYVNLSESYRELLSLRL